MHATVAIFFKTTEKPSYSEIEAAMEPFSEHNEESETHTITATLEAFKAMQANRKDQWERSLEYRKTEGPGKQDPQKHKDNLRMIEAYIRECEEALALTDDQILNSLEEDDSYIEDFGSVQSIDREKDEVEVTFMNPNGQWDWYVVGGRWRGSVLCIKPGTNEDHLIYGEGSSFDKVDGNLERKPFPDGCYVKDLHVEGLIEMRKERLKHLKEADPKEFWQTSKEDYIKKYEADMKTITLDTHLSNQIASYITVDGEWFSVEGEYKHEFLDYIKENYSDDLYVVIVDYHY